MRRLILLLSVIGSAILMSSRMVQSASAQKNDET